MRNDNETLKSAIDDLRSRMKREHDAVWQAGVHAIVEEMMLAAAGTVIQRAGAAREQFFDTLIPHLPAPPGPPTALESEPITERNGLNGHHYRDPFEHEEEFVQPRFMGGQG